MKDTKTIVNAALAGVISLGLLATVTQAQAAEHKGEKCYGVVKAGKNDCQTASSACAGHSSSDAQKDAWVYLPKGTCERIVGASTVKPNS